MKQFIILVFGFFLMQICLGSVNTTNQLCDNKQILGKIENVIILEKNITLSAKLDTGADMSSLSAQHIKISKDHGKDYVQFTVNLAQHQYTLEKPIIRYTKILKRKEESSLANSHSSRPVIILSICVGNHQQNLFVNLIDRSSFQYPMLLGSDALRTLNVLVDAAKVYTHNPHCKTP